MICYHLVAVFENVPLYLTTPIVDFSSSPMHTFLKFSKNKNWKLKKIKIFFWKNWKIRKIISWKNSKIIPFKNVCSIPFRWWYPLKFTRISTFLPQKSAKITANGCFYPLKIEQKFKKNLHCLDSARLFRTVSFSFLPWEKRKTDVAWESKQWVIISK